MHLSRLRCFGAIMTPDHALEHPHVEGNRGSHKVAGIHEAITGRRAQVFHLPLYSPDMNPIEMPVAKLKAC